MGCRLSPLILVLVVPFFTVAQDQPASRVRETELSRTPFIAGPLKITLTSFRAGDFLSRYGSVEVQVENISTVFAVFSPDRLSIVNRDNQQVDVLGIPVRNSYLSAAERRVAPAARIKETYVLNGKVHLPARLYYDQKLLAVIGAD